MVMGLGSVMELGSVMGLGQLMGLGTPALLQQPAGSNPSQPSVEQWICLKPSGSMGRLQPRVDSQFQRSPSVYRHCLRCHRHQPPSGIQCPDRTPHHIRLGNQR